MLIFGLIRILPTVPLMFVFLARTPFCICPASLISSNLWQLPSLSLLFRTLSGHIFNMRKGVQHFSLSLLFFCPLWGGRKQTPFCLNYVTFCLVSDFLCTWLVFHGCGRACPHALSLFAFRSSSVLACSSWSIKFDWAGFRYLGELSAVSLCGVLHLYVSICRSVSVCGLGGPLWVGWVISINQIKPFNFSIKICWVPTWWHTLY